MFHGTARLLHRHHQGHVSWVKGRVTAVHGQVHGATRGVGAVVQCVWHLPLPHLLFQLHPSVLEPDLDLPLGESESAGKLGPATTGEEVVEVELLLQLEDLLLRVHSSHSHQLRSWHCLLRLAMGLAQSSQERGVGGEGRHARHPPQHSARDEAVARDHRESPMGRRRDASTRRRPGTTFLNYNKDIIRVITAVQGASLRKPSNYSSWSLEQFIPSKTSDIGLSARSLKLLPLVVQGLVVGEGVFRFEEFSAERTVVLDEIVVDVSHVNLQHTPVLEPLSTILAIKV